MERASRVPVPSDGRFESSKGSGQTNRGAVVGVRIASAVVGVSGKPRGSTFGMTRQHRHRGRRTRRHRMGGTRGLPQLAR